MFCPECGSDLPDDARFCTSCGARIEDTDETRAMPKPRTRVTDEDRGPAPMPATALPVKAAQPEKPRKRHGAAIAVAAVVAVAAIAVAGGLVWWKLDQDRIAQEAYAEEHEPQTLVVPVEIDGYDASSGSMIPVAVQGTDLDGNNVNETQYVDEDGESLELMRGSYTLSVPASPFADDGGIYTVPSGSVKVEVGDSVETDGEFSFDKVDPEDATDEEIDAAYRYAKDGGCDSAERADDLRDKAVEARDAAVRAEQEAEARRRAAQRTVEATRFSVEIPDYWQGRVTWEVNGDEVVFYSTSYPGREVCRVYWQSNSSALQGSIEYLGGALLESSSEGTVAFSAPNYCYQIPWALRTNSTNPSDYYEGEEADELIALQSGGSVDYRTALDGYDEGDYSPGSACATWLQTSLAASFR